MNAPLFLGSLASLLEAGIALDHALSILMQMQGRSRSRGVIESLLRRVREGGSLSESMALHPRVFPSELRAVVRAGEEGGNLSRSLQEMAEFLERSDALRQKVMASLYYPIFLLVMALASVLVIVTWVLPEFEPIFASAGQQLPLLTRVVRAFGAALVDYFWLFAIIAAALALGIGYVQRQKRLRRIQDRALLRMPVVGRLLTIGQSASLARILGSQLSGGVRIIPALDTAAAALVNSEFAAATLDVRDNVQSGSKFAAALVEAGGFPELMVQLSRVGEETGRLDDMLLKVARFYERQLGLALDRMVAVMVPIMTLAMGLLVAAIVFSVLTAILGLNQLV